MEDHQEEWLELIRRSDELIAELAEKQRQWEASPEYQELIRRTDEMLVELAEKQRRPQPPCNLSHS